MRATVRIPFYNDDYINRRIEAQSTSFEVLRGKISAIITDDEIEEYRNGNITMASKLSAAIQTVDGFTQRVSDLQTSYNAATGEFATLRSKVSTFEQTVNGFRQTVSSYEQIQQQNANDIRDINDSLGEYVLSSQLGTEIIQTAGSIDLSVFKNTTLAKKTDLNDYTKTSALNQYIISNKSSLGITDNQIIAKVTGSSYWSDQATAIENLQDAQEEIDALTTEAMRVAKKKVTTYTSTSAPTKNTHPDLSDGDLWFNTTTVRDETTGTMKRQNIVKRWKDSTSTWEDCSDLRLAQAVTGIANLDDEKAQIFMQANAPANNTTNKLDQGDLWIETDQDNRIHIWNKSAAKWELADKALDELVQWKNEAEIALTKDSIYSTITEWGANGGKQIVNMINQSPSGTQILGKYVKIQAGDAIDLAITGKAILPYYSSTEPPSPKQGDIWYNTSSSNYKIYTYYNGQWRETEKDKVPKSAVLSAIRADTSGVKIQADKIELTASSDIQIGINKATTIGSGKSRTFRTSSKPTQGTDSVTNLPKIQTGDMWIDTANGHGNKMYYWNGSDWQEDSIISRINLSNENVTIDGGKIDITANDSFTLTAGRANTALTNAATAQTTANAKNTVFRQSSEPTAKKAGDIWVHTGESGSPLYYWSGSKWIKETPISKINASTEGITIDGKKIDISANDSFSLTVGNTNKALAQATTRSKIFRATKAPTQSTDSNGYPVLREGDMWVDTKSGNGGQIYIYSGSGWVQDTVVSRINTTSESVKINADKIDITAQSELRLMVTGKNSVFTQSEKPSTRTYNSTTGTYDINKGDIWYDTSNSYKMYVCTYVSGTTATWTPAVGDNVTKNTVISSIANSSETAKISSNKITLTSGSELANKVNDGQSKAKVFYTSTKPTQSTSNGIANIKTGDFWVDTRNSNRGDMYVWSGSSWVPEKLIARINASSEDESVQIKASRVAITAATLGIDASLVNVKAEDIRLQAKKIAWKSTNSVMTSEGELTSTDAASSPSTTILKSGHLEFTKTGTAIGRIGTNNFNANANYKGLVFDLERTGSYMAWAADTDTSDTNYELKWLYAKTADNANGYKANTLNALVPLHTHGNFISTYLDSSHKGYMRSRFRTADGTFGLASVTMNIFGMIVVVKDGIITDVYKGANSDTWSYSNKVTYES